MDPTLKSLLTSGIVWLSGVAATWGVAKGLIPASAQNEIVNALVTLVVAVGGGLVAYWKSRSHAPKAMIEAINKADNGVKVVDEKAPVPAVNGPLKEGGK